MEVKTMSSKSAVFFLLLLAIVMSSSSQLDGLPVAGENVLARHFEYLLRDGGRWLADNPEHQPGGESPASYGYAFTASLNQRLVRNIISGHFEDGKSVAYWECLAVWHPVQQKIVLYQFGAGGQVGEGEETRLDDQRSRVTMTLTPVDGEPLTFRDLSTITGPDSFDTVTEFLVDGEWQVRQRLSWRRVKVGK